MKNQNYILLAMLLFLSNSIFATEQRESEDPLPEEVNGEFSVGINVEPGYRAYGPKIGYKMNNFLGFQAALQYSSSNADNIQYEKIYLQEKMEKALLSANYKNSFVELLLDIYPLQNEIKTSFGIGYMDKKLTHQKDENLSLWNESKYFFVARLGYDGFVSGDSGMKFEISAGVRYLDPNLDAKFTKTEEFKNFKAKESEWKIIPNINVGLSYAF